VGIVTALSVLAVVASALADDGGTAVALDDGTVWLVYDGEWEELGGCDDGEVANLVSLGDGIEIECGDGSAWTWSTGDGWLPRSDEIAAVPAPGSPRSWWPALELNLRLWTPRGDRPTAFEGWVRLRWDL
jgi:hypothetical protein